MTIVDVRAVSEYEDFHIEGAVNIPVHELRELQKGFTKIQNAAGGMTGYAAAGCGPECPLCVLPWAPFRNK